MSDDEENDDFEARRALKRDVALDAVLFPPKKVQRQEVEASAPKETVQQQPPKQQQQQQSNNDVDDGFEGLRLAQKAMHFLWHAERSGELCVRADSQLAQQPRACVAAVSVDRSADASVALRTLRAAARKGSLQSVRIDAPQPGPAARSLAECVLSEDPPLLLARLWLVGFRALLTHDAHFARVARLEPTLRDLSLRGCTLFDDVGSLPRNLTALDVSDTRTTGAGMQRFRHLFELRVAGCARLDAAAFGRSLSGLRLRSLDLSRTLGWSAELLAAVLRQQSATLVELRLAQLSADAVPGAFLSPLLHPLPRLRLLDLSYCSGLLASHAEAFARNLPALHELVLEGVHQDIVSEFLWHVLHKATEEEDDDEEDF